MRIRISRVLAITLILGSLASLTALPGRAAAAGTAAISAVGPAQAVSAGQSFSVYVRVSPNNAIAGVQFNLSFNPSLLTVNGVAEGDLLGQGGAGTYFVPGQINNQIGSVSGIAGVIVSPGRTVSSPGTFAVVGMTAKSASGTSPLNLSSVIVGDVNGHAIPADIESGQVIISAPNPPPPAPPTGGGGGNSGGGGAIGGGFAVPGVTNLTIFTDGEGLFNLPGIANSEDGKAGLNIGKGVQAKTRDGGPLRSVVINPTTGVSSPPDGSMSVLSAYDFGPEGAVFNPPIALSISYDPTVLPDGVTEKNLIIGSWDQATGKWVAIQSTVDVLSHTVSTTISHFSRYAAIAQTRPATFTTSGLEISPPTSKTGQPVAIRVMVNNTGDVDGSHEVAVNFKSGDTSETLKQTVRLAGGASQVVEFTVTRQSAGLFKVSVDDLSASLVVEAQPAAVVAPRPESQIGIFSVTPSYTDALRIASAKLTYELVNPGEETTDAKLVLNVGLDGQAIDEATLYSASVPGRGATHGDSDYVPSSGWASGTYTFRLELYSGSTLIDSTADRGLEVRNEQAATVSWYVLALIVGISALVAAVTTVILLRRKQALLNTWAPDRPSKL